MGSMQTTANLTDARMLNRAGTQTNWFLPNVNRVMCCRRVFAILSAIGVQVHIARPRYTVRIFSKSNGLAG